MIKIERYNFRKIKSHSVPPWFSKQILYISMLFIIVSTNANGQDVHFSQFYANPLYMSPSLAGSTDGARFICNYRNQWPGINTAYETFSASFDNFFQSFNSGLGFLVYRDKAGSAGLTTTNFAFQYSYNLVINDFWQIVPGIQFSYGNKSIDFSKLQFGDEMIGNGGSGSWQRLSNDHTNYIDFASSLFLYSPKYWFGLTANHLSQPNYSFLNEETTLPLKFVFFGGMNIWKERSRQKGTSRSFSFSYRFQKQDQNTQTDLGVYWLNSPIELGAWYRGVPFLSSNNSTNINQDAIVALIAYKYGPYRFGYSYDISISGLGWNSQGAHEISFIYELNQRFNLRLNGKRPAIPCSDTSNPLINSRNKYKRKKRSIF